MRAISPQNTAVPVIEGCATLGEMVVAVRKSSGLSALWLAKKAGISRSTLIEIESGSPRVQMAHWLAVLDALDLLGPLVQGVSAAAAPILAEAITKRGEP